MNENGLSYSCNKHIKYRQTFDAVLVSLRKICSKIIPSNVMFTELFLFCMTAVLLLFVDKLSWVIGVTLFGILAYIYTLTRLDGFCQIKFGNRISFFNSYFERIEILLHFVISSPICRWIIHKTKAFCNFGNVRNGNKCLASETNSSSSSNSGNLAQQCDTGCSIDQEVTVIVKCILREYVKSWYHRVSQNIEFVEEMHYVISDTLAAFCGSIPKADEVFLCHILQYYIHFFHHFKEALSSITTDTGVLKTCLTKTRELHDNFKMHHWAMKDQVTEWTYLQSLMGTLLDSFGPTELSSCPLIHTVVMEILTQNIMYPLVNMLTDPSRLNEWIKVLLSNLQKVGNDTPLVPDISSPTPYLGTSSPKTTAGNKLFPSTQNPEIILSQNFLYEDSSEDIELNLYSSSDASVFNTSFLCQNSDVSNDRNSYFSNDSLKMGIDPTDLYESSSNKSFSEQNANTEIKPPYSSVLLRTRSNTNMSTKLCISNNETISENFKLPEGTHLKRSHSADYIRQMPCISLLPLNSSNVNVRYCQKTSRHFLQVKPNIVSYDVEVAEEAIEKEMPPLISDIKIIDTEEKVDAVYHPYTLYCIQYNGVFQKISSESHFPDLVIQVINIKRRFREFVALQSRFEDNPSIRCYLKGIRVPSKWLATPFTNLDKKNVANRKIFLESYLQQLCKQDPIIKSQEFQEFLAYGGDASIAFVKKTSDINVPRIDKFLVRSVKGAIDLFRTAVPTEVGILQEHNAYGTEDFADGLSFEKFPIYLVDYLKKNSDLRRNLDKILTIGTWSTSKECLRSELNATDDIRSGNKRKALLHHSHSINNKLGCNCNCTAATDSLTTDDLFLHVCQDFLAEFLAKSSLSHLLKLLPTNILQSLIEKKVLELRQEKVVELLHMFHRSVWPETKLSQSESVCSNMPHEVLDMINKLLEEWLSSNEFFKMFLRPLVGSKTISDSMELFLASIQNEKLNRCLLFYIFDEIIEFLCIKKEREDPMAGSSFKNPLMSFKNFL